MSVHGKVLAMDISSAERLKELALEDSMDWSAALRVLDIEIIAAENGDICNDVFVVLEGQASLDVLVLARFFGIPHKIF